MEKKSHFFSLHMYVYNTPIFQEFKFIFNRERALATQDKCAVCHKTVYPLEKVCYLTHFSNVFV